jgi:hypothetical protein
MNWKHTFVIVLSILIIGMGLGYLISYHARETKNLYHQLIDKERKVIDSLFGEIKNIEKQRNGLEVKLESLTKNIIVSETNLSTKINQLKIQNNVKIDAITNSTNDELLGGLRTRFIKK